MAIRAKAKRTTPRRRTVAVASRPKAAVRRGHAVNVRKGRMAPELKPAPSSTNGLGRAVRYLSSLSDYERLRIVRYTSQNFDLERMRALLKRLGNPHEQFKTVHVAGTKEKGSTCAMVAAKIGRAHV